MPDTQKKSSSSLIAIIVLLLLVAGAGLYFFQKKSGETMMQNTAQNEQPKPMKVADASDSDDNAHDHEPHAGEESSTNSETFFAPATEMQDALSTEEALAVRSVGSMDAPVVITEHSSLTCGHCGNFHKGTYKQIKKDYVDTGKVRIIFDDFPLNGPALHASIIARCVPADRYFDYVQLLFEKQDDWAYSRDYVQFLKQSSQLAGLSPEGFETCMNNKELQEGLLANRQNAAENKGVKSTPTLVLSDGVQISGSRPYADFKKIIDVALESAGKL